MLQQCQPVLNQPCRPKQSLVCFPEPYGSVGNIEAQNGAHCAEPHQANEHSARCVLVPVSNWTRVGSQPSPGLGMAGTVIWGQVVPEALEAQRVMAGLASAAAISSHTASQPRCVPISNQTSLFHQPCVCQSSAPAAILVKTPGSDEGQPRRSSVDNWKLCVHLRAGPDVLFSSCCLGFRWWKGADVHSSVSAQGCPRLSHRSLFPSREEPTQLMSSPSALRVCFLSFCKTRTHS